MTSELYAIETTSINDVRIKTKILQEEIYKLVQTFEKETSMIVHNVDLLHEKFIYKPRFTQRVELDIHLN